jgi:hypothetical protein
MSYIRTATVLSAWSVGLACGSLSACAPNDNGRTQAAGGSVAAVGQSGAAGQSSAAGIEVAGSASGGFGGGGASVSQGGQPATDCTNLTGCGGAGIGTEVAGAGAGGSLEPSAAGAGGSTAPSAQYLTLWASAAQCLDVPMQHFVAGQALQSWQCIGATSQEYTLDSQGKLHSYAPDLCVSAPPSGAPLALAPCAQTDTFWALQDGNLQLKGQAQCATLPRGSLTGNGEQVLLEPCAGVITRQRWVSVAKGTAIAPWSFLPETSRASVASRCSPLIEPDTTLIQASGAAWLNKTAPDTAAILTDVFHRVCAELYESVDEVPDIRLVHSGFVQDTSGLAYTVAASDTVKGVYMNLSYFASDPTDAGLVGVWEHESTHVWQYSGARGLGNDVQVWEIEGFADFVRYRIGGGLTVTLAARTHGGSYQDGYQTTGFFFDWIDRTWPGSLRAFNLELGVSQRTNTKWPDDWFTRTTGKGVDSLWSQYQSSF